MVSLRRQSSGESGPWSIPFAAFPDERMRNICSRNDRYGEEAAAPAARGAAQTPASESQRSYVGRPPCWEVCAVECVRERTEIPSGASWSQTIREASENPAGVRDH